MSIKSQGGVFGRNPTFATLTVENGISVGSLTVGGETITGLSYQGAWNANTNSPDITASPAQGQFWIVSVDGSTNVGGITNWTTGDWALYDGSSWQRVEGGNTDLSSGVTGQLAVTNGGTGASDAATARTNLGLGSAATTASTDYATAAQGSLADSAVQPGDLGTAAYTASTAYATAAQGSTADSALQPADIGVSVQAYDADTAKLDVAQTWTANQQFNGKIGVGALAPYVGAHYNTLHLGGMGAIRAYDTATITADTNITTNAYEDNTGTFRYQITDRATKYDQTYGKHRWWNTTSNGSPGSAITWDFKMELDQAGNLNIKKGNLVLGTAGNGIDFSATSGTGTSELFDDYEEGTWTPTNPTVGFSSATGNYTKIGNTVIAYFDVTWNSNSSGIDAIIRGFPFAGGGNGASSTSIMYTNYGTANLYFNDSSTPGCKLVNSSGTDLSNSNVSTKNFKGMAVYKAA